MKATKPILHAHDHRVGGADPVLPGFPTGDTLDEKLAVLAAAWWKLDETTGTVAHDSSGNNHHLTSDAVVGTSYTPPTWGQPAGPPGTTTALWVDATTRVSTPTASPMVDFTDDFTAGVWVNFQAAPIVAEELIGQGQPIHSGGHGWALIVYPGVSPHWMFSVFVNGTVLSAANPLTVGTWYFVAAVRDTGVWKLYVDALLQPGTLTGSPGSGYGDNTWLGSDGYVGHSTYLRDCLLSYGFIVDRAMSGVELADLLKAADTPPVTDHTGYVLGVGPDGQPVWQPPGVEVTHGGGTPDETPAPGPPPSEFVGTPTTPSGWHIQAHTETAVLYDSTPGRFDVPTMKWVRVPFNTVRILRTWETAVDGPTKSAWLPEDRGLTEAARDGLLLITAGMVATPGNLQHLEGFFSIEYPVVDYAKLPDDDVPIEHGPIVGFDEYVRGARLFQPQSGAVTRVSPGDTHRAMISWAFPDPPEEDLGGGYTSDDPFPIYPPNWGHWTRPLHLPQPYPAMTPTDSLDWYTRNDVGYPPFGEVQTLTADADLPAGATICLQAWQDTPYTLRFSTDHFPNYSPLPINPPYGMRPYLSISYLYDPDDIDHTSGKRNPGS
jgi:hypothetical protein